QPLSPKGRGGSSFCSARVLSLPLAHTGSRVFAWDDSRGWAGAALPTNPRHPGSDPVTCRAAARFPPLPRPPLPQGEKVAAKRSDEGCAEHLRSPPRVLNFSAPLTPDPSPSGGEGAPFAALATLPQRQRILDPGSSPGMTAG